MLNDYQISLSFYKKGSKHCLFSVLQTNHYQTVDNLSIKTYSQIVTDKKWGNKVIIFNDVNKKLKITFNLQPKIIKKEIDKKFFLRDYQNKKIKIINNQFVNGDNPQIKSLAKKIIGKEKNLKKIVRKLYDFSLDYLTYGKPIKGLYTYREALTEKITDCGGFSTFLASLLQSLNIPTRLVVGFLIKENIFTKFFSRFDFCTLNFDFLIMHAWLEILLPDNTWFPMDPSIEWKRNRGLTKRQGGFGYIPSDRLVVSFGCDFNIKIDKINYSVDLLQNPVYL